MKLGSEVMKNAASWVADASGSNVHGAVVDLAGTELAESNMNDAISNVLADVNTQLLKNEKEKLEKKCTGNEFFCLDLM